jgi:very-short-patch-repair endonuclease
MWYGLRAHRLAGVAFRRQSPIGPYIVDFVSHSAKLIIEIDGSQHAEEENARRDRRRQDFLVSKGFRVLRFNNYDVLTNRNGVLETIFEALKQAASPSLTLPRKRGREQTEPGRAVLSPPDELLVADDSMISSGAPDDAAAPSLALPRKRGRGQTEPSPAAAPGREPQ